ncbi:MAG: hypothetical protein IJI98_04210 [Methanosphaera sp.]|uniref:hypothetical protein n=1 Tax=Methanosphaera sp. ISO3-F5 TaxID=1452353 RepID=UPI002B257AD7|nr:hypothetical protein [Methanosphaera sp. ISO3-F5]MBR0471882.1 hypothetical protein [Methanosphaera sp.]WQH64849.1 hypothetical protein PXD04_03425 [Methanosphaera sp. ISO3-F5]
MTNNKKSSNKGSNENYDPLEELNVLDDNFTIETEKDFFDEFEQKNLENVPEYDSESGKIIKGSEPSSKKQNHNIEDEKFQLMDEIEQVDFNNVNAEKDNQEETVLNKEVKPQKPNKTPKKGKKFDLSSKLGLNKKDKKPIARPKKQVHKFDDKEKSLNDDTKIIDNVKVDSDGVPLLNQFDTDKIIEKNPLPKITVRRISFSKIIMIAVGIIITLIGIFQAMQDVVKISDHVMYGEHESIAMGLILLGIILIILSFYKEIMKLSGLNNLTNMMDDMDSSSKPQPRNKKNKK